MQINSINKVTNFGLKFTDNAKKLIKAGKEQYIHDGTRDVLLDDLYEKLQNDEFNNCELDVDENGDLSFTVTITKKFARAPKDKKNQYYAPLESLYDTRDYIYKQLKTLKEMKFKFKNK